MSSPGIHDVSFLEGTTGANYACRYTNARGGAAVVYRVARLGPVNDSDHRGQRVLAGYDDTAISW